MLQPINIAQPLDLSALPPHSTVTCGKFRRGGVGTSHCTRRSNFFGRVAVAYVQGSPKGGGALCVRRVPNTRLAPVPPSQLGGLMRAKAKLIFCTLVFGVVSTTPAHAQSLGDLLGNMIQSSVQSSQRSAAKQQEHQELLRQINALIDRAPNDACALPHTDIERWAAESVAKGDLLGTVRTSVFSEPASGPAKLTGLDAMNEKIRQDTARRFAEAQAVYAGGQVPVGDQANVKVPDYSVGMKVVQATERIENGLKCSGKVQVSSSIVGTHAGFWFPITYSVTLAPSEMDGWLAEIMTGPESFSEQYALGHPDMIRIRFNGADVSLAEARVASSEMRARAAAERANQERQEAAQAAYANSQAGRAAKAAAEHRAELDNARKQQACEAHGGTWGYRINPSGPLGCYFQTLGD